jgi:glycosyltransferase domain-containing protein
MQILRNLTLITITKDRPKCLLQTLKYYEGSGINFFICDGSKKKIEKKYLNFDININYYHFPNLTWEQRVNFAIHNIKTRYSAFNHDDDFFLITSLKFIIKKMESNRRLIAAGGKHYGFKNNNKKTYINLLNPNTSTTSYKKNFKDKVKSFFFSYDNTLHSSIFCSNILKKVERNISKNNLNKYNLREIFHGIGILGSGDFKFVDLPLFFRNENNIPHRFNDPMNDINNNFSTWYFTKNEIVKERIIFSFYKISKLQISYNKYKKILNFFLAKVIKERYDNKFYKSEGFIAKLRFVKSKIDYNRKALIKMIFKINYKRELNKNIISKNLNKKIISEFLKDINNLKNVLNNLK